jgi:ribosomal protein L7/L12
VDAINSQRIDRRQALAHPRARTCGNADADAVREEMWTRQWRHTIPPDYRSTLTPRPAGEPLMFAEQFDYAVVPTHTLQLEYKAATGTLTAIIVNAVNEGGAWYEVTPCPKAATIALIQAAKQRRLQHEARVDALVAAIPPALKSEVLSLVATGKKISAVERYRAATGEDLTTATDVVERLSGTSR